MEAKERPWGVSVIAVLQLFAGIYAIYDGIILLGWGQTAVAAGDAAGNTVVIWSVLGLVLGVLSLLMFWGLWTLAAWGWWGTLAVRAADVVLAVVGIFAGTPNLLALLFSVAIIAYLVQRSIRQEFGLTP